LVAAGFCHLPEPDRANPPRKRAGRKATNLDDQAGVRSRWSHDAFMGGETDVLVTRLVGILSNMI
jgi:hypothetical protein